MTKVVTRAVIVKAFAAGVCEPAPTCLSAPQLVHLVAGAGYGRRG